MSEEAAFMRAICEHPDDDVVRLVYADWLDEHGRGDRAEFIRDGIRAPGGGSGYGAPWFVFGADPRRLSGITPGHSRGFVNHLRARRAAGFIVFAPDLFAAHPITSVDLADRAPDITLDGWPCWHHMSAEEWDAGDWELADSVIHADLFDLLPVTGLRPGGDYTMTKPFGHAAAARAALGAACVAWGRAKAGLPPLTVAPAA